MKDLTRRNFLKVLGASAIITAGGGAIIKSPTEILSPSPEEVEVFSKPPEHFRGEEQLPYFVMEIPYPSFNKAWEGQTWVAQNYLMNISRIELFAHSGKEKIRLVASAYKARI
jgi:hypothetical protein